MCSHSLNCRDGGRTTIRNAIDAMKNISLDVLTGLKGIIAVVVTYGHFLKFYLTEEDSNRFGFLYQDFYQGGTMFFIISGFICAVFYGDVRKFSSWQGKVEFWKKRLLRLAPLYYLSVVMRLPLFIELFWNQPEAIWSAILVTATMTQSVFKLSIPYLLHFAVWYVSALVICYGFYPFALQSLKKQTTSGLWRTLFACWVVPIASLTVFFLLSSRVLFEEFAHTFVLFRGPQFFAGVILALLLDTSAIMKITSDKWDMIADIGSIALALTQVGCSLLMGSGSVEWVKYMFFCEYLLLPLHMAWVAALIKGKSSLTYRILNSKLAITLGDISYGLFCLHYPIMSWIVRLMYGNVPISISKFNSKGFFVLSIGKLFWILPLCLFLSWFAHKYFEAPSLAFAKRYLRIN